jgi:hypothetical protein
MRTLLLLLFMLAFPALAADPDPINAALDACLAKPEGSSTVGMVECTGDAIRAWDKRLNEVYQQVMAGLNPKFPGASARVPAPIGWRSGKESMRPWEGLGGRTGARSSAC